MMQQITQTLLFLFLATTIFTQEAWTDKSRILPDALRKIPVAIYISHSPNPNYPEVNPNRNSDDSDYVWKHATTICSPTMNLTVLKAGSFIWYDESGWKENVVYDRKDFRKKFDCPKGELKKGDCYTFEKNYRWGNQLYGGDALWYVMAKDANGKLYKGFGLIETESELLNK